MQPKKQVSISPVFIGGCPRSGTTLMGSVLGRHPSTVCVPESEYKVDLIRYLRANGPQPWRNVYGFLRRNPKFRLWEIEPNGFDDNELIGEPDVRRVQEAMIRQYCHQIQEEFPSIWVDHSPTNIQSVNTLNSAFPSAKYIHMVRDGRACISSIIGLDWGPNSVTGGARWWARRLCYGLAAELSAPTSVMRVHFEDLVAHPRETMLRVCSFLDLDLSEALFAEGGFRVPTWTAAQHSLVGGNFAGDAINGWRKHLSGRDIERFEHETHDLLALLGYQLDYKGGPRGASTKERIGEIGREIWDGRIKNRIRFKRRMGISFYKRY